MSSRNRNFEKIYSFIYDNSSYKKLVKTNLEFLRPIFNLVNDRSYVFARVEDLNYKDLVTAIKFVTGREVKKITPVPLLALCHNYNKEGWVRRKIIKTSIVDMTAYSPFWGSLPKQLITDFQECLSQNTLPDKFSSFSDLFYNSLAPTFGILNQTTFPYPYLHADKENDLLCDFANPFWDTMYYFLGFTMAGDQARAERFRFVLYCFQKTIPFGESRMQPGVWFVPFDQSRK